MTDRREQPGEMTEAPVRVAMWSGPRNLSTALLRSWGNRNDTAVSDEPLYAHYLHTTGADHPARDEILATYDSDWRQVARHLTGPVPGRRAIWYQKHMAHHVTYDVDLDWLGSLRNCFLIRNPAEVIASYSRVRGHPTLEDLGLPQQWRLFSSVVATGATPPVIDAEDLLRDPATVLSALCTAVGVEFSDRMLSWPPGPRDTDGVWAKHWYGSVERSTGFARHQPSSVRLDDRFAELHAAADAIYRRLATYRLSAVPT